MTLIIAEAGVNHNGRKDLAFKLIDVAHSAGADIVKFQTFKASKVVTKYAEQDKYQTKNTKKKETQLSMLKKLELPYEAHFELMTYCEKLGIEFLSTAFDEESLQFLVYDLGLKRLKLPSGELTNSPLVLAHARTGCDLIVSTGMATLGEIEEALGVIAFGYLSSKTERPSKEIFKNFYASPEGQAILRKKVTLLHCTTEYPVPFLEINLNVLKTFTHAFGLKVGYSDHSEGIEIPIAAVASGALLIEKHFTLDKQMEGPDHKASLEPDELTSMVKSIRNVDIALGSSVKAPTTSEAKNKHIARKSLVAACDIKKGDVFDDNNLTMKRPGGGIDPINYWDILGSHSPKKYKKDEFIT
jgi:N-acetylneuraminate synthase